MRLVRVMPPSARWVSLALLAALARQPQGPMGIHRRGMDTLHRLSGMGMPMMSITVVVGTGGGGKHDHCQWSQLSCRSHRALIEPSDTVFVLFCHLWCGLLLLGWCPNFLGIEGYAHRHAVCGGLVNPLGWGCVCVSVFVGCFGRCLVFTVCLGVLSVYHVSYCIISSFLQKLK